MTDWVLNGAEEADEPTSRRGEETSQPALRRRPILSNQGSVVK